MKPLDGVDVDVAGIGSDGGLESDREFAVVDADGEDVNGKRERDIHRVRADFDHDFRLMVNTAVPAGSRETELRSGDAVEVLETVAAK